LNRYPLEGLLSVRVFREDAAAETLGEAELRLAEAGRETETRRQELAAYRLWREAEVQRRYQAIMGQILSQSDLYEFNSGLAWLDTQEQARAESVVEAEKLEQKAKESLEKARTELREAAKAREKISRHREIWLEGAAREAERLEDLELEEFKPVVFE
jgi:type III secretion protein O